MRKMQKISLTHSQNLFFPVALSFELEIRYLTIVSINWMWQELWYFLSLYSGSSSLFIYETLNQFCMTFRFPDYSIHLLKGKFSSVKLTVSE